MSGNGLFYVLIVPIALVCVMASIWFWFPLTHDEQTGPKIDFRAYVPLALGFAVSMFCVAVLTYIESAANFSWLVEHGRYSEFHWSDYMPRRITTQAILNLVFVLPAISFAIIPMTVKLVKARRLTWRVIGLRALIGWLSLSLIGWLGFLHSTQLRAVLVFALATLIPVAICALPIPASALLFFRRRAMPAPASP